MILAPDDLPTLQAPTEATNDDCVDREMKNPSDYQKSMSALGNDSIN